MGGQEQQVAAYFDQPFYLAKTFDIRLRREIVQSLLPQDLRAVRCLDAGCGDGSLSLPYLAELQSLTMADLSENMLELAGRKVPPELRDKVTLCQCAIDELPQDQYDLILCIGVLAHVSDVPLTLQKLIGLLTCGGTLIIQITDSKSWVAKLNRAYNHLLDFVLRRYTYRRNKVSAADLSAMTQRLGLKLLEQRRFGLIAPGMQALMSDELLFKYHRFVYHNRRLAQRGSDVILKFKKSQPKT